MDSFLEKTFCLESVAESLWMIFAIVVIFLATSWYQKTSKGKLPPCHSGWIPWLGCAIEFGKDPLNFIHKAKEQMGPIFTLKVTGKRLTFLTAPEDIQIFFNSENLSFQDAVQKPVKMTANIPAYAFYQSHTKIHDTVKGRLSPGNISDFTERLQKSFTKEIMAWGNKGESDLNTLVRRSMYKSVLDNLFGEHTLPTHNETQFDIFEKHFVKFDDEFEYGSQLPEFFLSNWSRSKNWLLNQFDTIVNGLQKVPENEETVLQTLVRTIDDPYASNFGLLMMWASLANAIPITFWALAFILDTPQVLQDIKKELHDVMQKKDAGTEITEEDLEKLPTIRWSMLEAIRLRSPGVITRKVMKDIYVKDYVIPAGDDLMLSPYWSHRNKDFFPKCEDFIPKRWENVGKDKFLEGFVAFGGGRYQCPGRWFALMEIQLFLALVLHHFEIKLQGSVPKNSPLHLVGTQQPLGPCVVKFSQKDS